MLISLLIQTKYLFIRGSYILDRCKFFTIELYLMYWRGVDYCDVWTAGAHSLQRIHCWASDCMLHFFKSDKETNSSTSGMSTSANVHFWLNHSLTELCWVQCFTDVHANVSLHCIYRACLKSSIFYDCSKCCTLNKLYAFVKLLHLNMALDYYSSRPLV